MGAGLEAGLGHAFAQAALADEGFVERAQEAVEEEVGWVNEADGHVGDDVAGARLREVAIEVEGLGVPAPEDVLLSGTGGLDHRVHGAVTLGEVLVGEVEGEVIEDLGLLVAEEALVMAVRWQDAGGLGGSWG